MSPSAPLGRLVTTSSDQLAPISPRCPKRATAEVISLQVLPSKDTFAGRAQRGRTSATAAADPSWYCPSADAPRLARLRRFPLARDPRGIIRQQNHFRVEVEGVGAVETTHSVQHSRPRPTVEMHHNYAMHDVLTSQSISYNPQSSHGSYTGLTSSVQR